MLVAGVPRFPLLLYATSVLGKRPSNTGLVLSIRSNYLKAKAGGSKKNRQWLQRKSLQELLAPPPETAALQCQYWRCSKTHTTGHHRNSHLIHEAARYTCDILSVMFSHHYCEVAQSPQQGMVPSSYFKWMPGLTERGGTETEGWLAKSTSCSLIHLANSFNSCLKLPVQGLLFSHSIYKPLSPPVHKETDKPVCLCCIH